MQSGIQAENTDFLYSDLDILGTSMLSSSSTKQIGCCSPLI